MHDIAIELSDYLSPRIRTRNHGRHSSDTGYQRASRINRMTTRTSGRCFSHIQGEIL